MKNNIPQGIPSKMVERFTREGMKSDTTAELLTCRGYCEYYRGDQSEAGCGGLGAVKKGIATGKIGVAEISHLVDTPPENSRRSGCLINEMCLRCSYLVGGCDFMSASPPPDATPCGGYRLLQALLDHGALSPDVVRTLIQNTAEKL